MNVTAPSKYGNDTDTDTEEDKDQDLDQDEDTTETAAERNATAITAGEQEVAAADSDDVREGGESQPTTSGLKQSVSRRKNTSSDESSRKSED